MALFNVDNDPYDDEEYLRDVPPAPEKKPKSKKFLVIIILLGGVLLLALAGLFVYAPKYLANQRNDRLEQAALLNAANTATSIADASSINQELTAITTAEPGVVPTVEDMVTPAASSEPTATGVSNFTIEELATIAALQTQMALGGTPVVTGTEAPGGETATDEIPFPTEGTGLDNPTVAPTEVLLTEVAELVNTVAATPVVVETDNVNDDNDQAPTMEVLMTEVTEDVVAGEPTALIVATEAPASGGEVQLTPTPVPTELPDTGLADNLRLPLLAGLAVLLVVIIIFSRRLRLSSK